MPFRARIFGCAGLMATAFAAYSTVYIAWADWVRRENTETSIRASIAMVPDNWNFHRDLAELLPAQAVPELKRAIALNPRNSLLRIELGEYAEQAKDFSTAEAAFQSALAIDRTLAPRAELAAFYFHRRDAAHFLDIVRPALEKARSAPVTLFDQCWDLVGDGNIILRDAIPDRQEILRPYLAYLLEKNRLVDAAPVVRRVMADRAAGSESREVVLAYCDRTLAVGNVSESAAAWDWLIGRRMVTAPALGATIKRGFDWRYESGGGLYFDSLGSQGLRISLSGKQPENCDVLWRYVALASGARYRLQVDSRSPGPESGLRWQVLMGGVDLLTGTEFQAPVESALARLVLRYDRAKGTVRLEGDTEIHTVELRRE